MSKKWKSRAKNTILTLIAIIGALEANQHYGKAREALIEHMNELLIIMRGG